MSACTDCGAEVRFEITPEGKKVRLDKNATAINGERYAINNDNFAVRVSPTYFGYGHPDHDKTCPVKVRDRERF